MKKCKVCGKTMKYKEGKYKGHWICINYPVCNNAVDEGDDKSKVTRKNVMGGMSNETFEDHREEDLKDTFI